MNPLTATKTHRNALKNILIIEDNPADVTQYLRLLEAFDHGFSNIETVSKVTHGYDRIQTGDIDCCLLDNNLPDGTASEMLDRLGKEGAATCCPIIVITELEDLQVAVELMQKGAQDYLVKQHLSAMLLEKAIRSAIHTWELQQNVNNMALYDSLTGLVNRALFIDRLDQLFQESQRYSRHFALLYLDMDRFKYVNDTYGHEAGDALLQEISDRLLRTLRSADTVARLGGDEFAIILPDINEAKANHVAYKLVHVLSFTMPWQRVELSTSPSIGLAYYPSHASSYQEMMRDADLALYRAKSQGRCQYSAFNKKIEAEQLAKQTLIRHLPNELLSKRLKLAWQPIFDAKSNKVSAVEALVRWRHQDNWVPPEKIIDLVLECRLGDSFHTWLFEHAMEQIAQWRHTHPTLKLSLNIPASLCYDNKLITLLMNSGKQHGLPAENLMVEVTETHLMRYPDEVKKQLIVLSDYGIEIAIDDFGTGYSSMDYIASLPCNCLKIDKKFFLGLHHNPRNAQIIEAITALSHRLGMKVVAEGIESGTLLQAAQAFGCDYMQGYFLGAPVFHHDQFHELCRVSENEGARLIAG